MSTMPAGRIIAAMLVRARRVAGPLLALLLGGLGTAQAQQLEPRVYSPAPIGMNFVGLGGLYSSGSVLTDPSLPIANVRARLYGVTPYYGRTFGLAGRVASATLVIPFGTGHVQGDVQEVSRSVDRSGLFDPQLRVGVNLVGCPAMKPREFMKRKPATTIGASLTVSAPFGQYDPSKLINLGTNRWAYKPELGLSKPVGDWVIEIYAGVWLFQANQDFYGGNVRTQDPLASYQAHAVYNFRRDAWAAADFTYYDGGSTTVGGQAKNDRQANSRGGLTVSVPCGKAQSLRLTWADGATTRIGSNFQTVGAGWQFRWF